MTTELTCPQCKKLVLWNDDYPYRPFCCQRCQLIDLGEWAEESYAIPAENQDNEENW